MSWKTKSVCEYSAIVKALHGVLVYTGIQHDTLALWSGIEWSYKECKHNNRDEEV